jgi:hypothetical protein
MGTGAAHHAGMGPREARMDTGAAHRAGMRLGVAGEARWEVGRRRGFPRVGVWSRADLLFADGGAVVPEPLAVPQPSAQDNQ